MSGDARTINGPQNKVIWKWSSIALQMSVLSIRERVHMLPKRSSRVPQILTRRSQSALGLEYCLSGGHKWPSPHTRISCRA